MSPTAQTAASFEHEQCFMLVEITGGARFFRVVSCTGKIVDSGVIQRQAQSATTGPAGERAALGATLSGGRRETSHE